MTTDPVNPPASAAAGTDDLLAVWSEIQRKQAAGQDLTPAEGAAYFQAADYAEGEARSRWWSEIERKQAAGEVLTPAEAEDAAWLAGYDRMYEAALYESPDDGDEDGTDDGANDGAAGW